MTNTRIDRRAFLGGTLGAFAALGLAACSKTTSTTRASTAGESTTSVVATTSDVVVVPTLAELTPLAASFTQASYTDSGTGKVLPYNIFLPAEYSTDTKYPLVHYIADSSLVGREVTAPLSQYGALIWASPGDQAARPSIVVVPEYPEIILDDHIGFTMTDYVELTARFVDFLTAEYSVDTDRVYGTGQSMGCMTTMYLTATHPDLFAAEMLVSGQWDISTLGNLTGAKFVYVAAAGDTNSSGGQTEVENLFSDAGVPFRTTTLDATQDAASQEAAVRDMLSAGTSAGFANFAAGTVLTANPVSNMEHMASFEPAYKITAFRDWLFEQRA